jgi:hypothetical protein
LCRNEIISREARSEKRLRVTQSWEVPRNCGHLGLGKKAYFFGRPFNLTLLLCSIFHIYSLPSHIIIAMPVKEITSQGQYQTILSDAGATRLVNCSASASGF